jgi:hypothetical protein
MTRGAGGAGPIFCTTALTKPGTVHGSGTQTRKAICLPSGDAEASRTDHCGGNPMLSLCGAAARVVSRMAPRNGPGPSLARRTRPWPGEPAGLIVSMEAVSGQTVTVRGPVPSMGYVLASMALLLWSSSNQESLPGIQPDQMAPE